MIRSEAQLEPSPHELCTDRLRLVPLNADGMRLFADEWPALQRRLGLTLSSAWMTDRDTLEAARRHRREMLRDPGAWLWWTFWQVVLASDDVSIGLVDFKGPPGPDGGIAVGCSFAPTYWGRGYATEAVGALLAKTLSDSAVRYILADTGVTNVKAHRILEKLGFLPGEHGPGGIPRHGDTEEMLVWRFEKRSGVTCSSSEMTRWRVTVAHHVNTCPDRPRPQEGRPPGLGNL